MLYRYYALICICILLAAAASCLRLLHQMTEYAANPNIAMVTYGKFLLYIKENPHFQLTSNIHNFCASSVGKQLQMVSNYSMVHGTCIITLPVVSVFLQ